MTTKVGISVRCKLCGHKRRLGNAAAVRLIGSKAVTPATNLAAAFNRKKSKLRCNKCGARDPVITPFIEKGRTAKPARASEHNYEKRYIDEGLAGSREDHKKMRERQRKTNLSHKF